MTTTTNFGDGWKTGAERLVRCSDNGGGLELAVGFRAETRCLSRGRCVVMVKVVSPSGSRKSAAVKQ